MAVSNQLVVDVGAIRQEHIGKGAPVLVLPDSLKRTFFPKTRTETAKEAGVNMTTVESPRRPCYHR